jgi:hypothetical protein
MALRDDLELRLEQLKGDEVLTESAKPELQSPSLATINAEDRPGEANVAIHIPTSCQMPIRASPHRIPMHLEFMMPSGVGSEWCG